MRRELAEALVALGAAGAPVPCMLLEGLAEAALAEARARGATLEDPAVALALATLREGPYQLERARELADLVLEEVSLAAAPALPLSPLVARRRQTAS